MTKKTANIIVCTVLTISVLGLVIFADIILDGRLVTLLAELLNP